jgi:predicted AAA+ superfamily ATPase
MLFMQTIIEQLIADFQERKLPNMTRRRAGLPWIPGKIDTVIGMRRSGKTWFLYQVMDELLQKGFPAESLLYINFEDERLLPCTASDLQQIPDTYYRRYPQLKDRKCVYFFDEIQNVQGWERFVRRMLDSEDAHICLTGSSSRLLSSEIATSLRGRSVNTEIFPFSFAEFLDHAGIDSSMDRHPGSKRRAILENRLTAYLEEGGFPEVQGLRSHHRISVLQEYLDVVVLRDLVERHGITNVVALRYMIRHLLNAPASLFSVQKFYNDLKSQGIPCGKNTLHEFFDYLADAYLFFPVCIHTSSERSRMVNPRKVYTVDTGMIRACSRSTSPDWGHILENFVFMELRRRFKHIEYYRTESGREVDFYVLHHTGDVSLIQAAAAMEDNKTAKREINALTEAMDECGAAEGSIVTYHTEQHLEINSKRIHIVPAWKWALSLD